MPKIFRTKLHCTTQFKSIGMHFEHILFRILVCKRFSLWFFFSLSSIRLETTKLLLDAGADPFAKSKNGDDALQIACLKGAHDIFRHLIERISYSKERLASANELIGKWR